MQRLRLNVVVAKNVAVAAKSAAVAVAVAAEDAEGTYGLS